MSDAWWRDMASGPVVATGENFARVGDVVARPGSGQEMVVVDVTPGPLVVTAWRHRSGQMHETSFAADKLRLVRRGESR